MTVLTIDDGGNTRVSVVKAVPYPPPPRYTPNVNSSILHLQPLADYVHNI